MKLKKLMVSGPISRILCGVCQQAGGRCGDHSSGPTIARRLKRPTRARIGGDKCFREEHEVRALPGRIGRQRVDFFKRPVAIKRHRRRLHDRDFHQILLAYAHITRCIDHGHSKLLVLQLQGDRRIVHQASVS